MNFNEAVGDCAALSGHLRKGLQALKAADRERITCKTPRLLAGSVDVDTALSAALPQANRWDYAIGVKLQAEADAVIWIEVHPASSTGEVEVVLRKMQWLKEWSQSQAWGLHRLTREYVWVATGSVVLSANGPQRRRLAQAGIRFVGTHYELR